jgi:hypothetical protein
MLGAAPSIWLMRILRVVAAAETHFQAFAAARPVTTGSRGGDSISTPRSNGLSDNRRTYRPVSRVSKAAISSRDT